MQVSRKQALAMQEGKAAQFTVISALDFYKDEYQKHLAAMLRGEPYSQIVMDTALENIMKIAVEEESHIQYGELIDQQEAQDVDWLREPTDDDLRAIEREPWADEPPTNAEQADAAFGTLDLEGFSWQDDRNSKPIV